MILYIPVGIPGCGKSTLVKALSPRTTVSSDAIRAALSSVEDQSRNAAVFEIFYNNIETSLELGLPGATTFADATNLDSRSRATLCDIAQRTGADTHLILFRNLEQAIARNLKRDRVVPGDVMLRMIEKYERAVQDIEHETYNYVTEVSAVR